MRGGESAAAKTPTAVGGEAAFGLTLTALPGAARQARAFLPWFALGKLDVVCLRVGFLGAHRIRSGRESLRLSALIRAGEVGCRLFAVQRPLLGGVGAAGTVSFAAAVLDFSASGSAGRGFPLFPVNKMCLCS